MVSVALLTISSRKDLLKQTEWEEVSFDRMVSLVAVAAAAVVPSSLMSSTALWAACQGKQTSTLFKNSVLVFCREMGTHTPPKRPNAWHEVCDRPVCGP